MLEEELWTAALENNVPKVESVLRDNLSTIDVNWKNPSYFNWTALYTSSDPKVTRLLLSHPNVDLNEVNSLGSSPFLRACGDGRADLVALLLGDPRLDVNQASPDNERTGVWKAARWGHCSVVKVLIASSREFDAERTGRWLGEDYTPLQIAYLVGNVAVADLLRRFLSDPDRTRFQVQEELGVTGALVTKLFAMVVFYCDGFLCFHHHHHHHHHHFHRCNKNSNNSERNNNHGGFDRFLKRGRKRRTDIQAGNDEEQPQELRRLKGERLGDQGEEGSAGQGQGEDEEEEAEEAKKESWRRFFRIVARLPMELEMLICHRVYGSSRQNVPSRMAELAFRALVRHK